MMNSVSTQPDHTQNLINVDLDLDCRFNKLDINRKVKNRESNQVSDSTFTLHNQVKLSTSQGPSESEEYSGETQVKYPYHGNDHKDHTGIQRKDNESKNNPELSSRYLAAQQSQKDENYAEVISSDDEHSLNEFLTHTVQTRMKFMKKRSENLEKALAVTQEKVKNVSSQMSDSNKVAKEASKEAIALKRALLSKEAVLKKKDKNQSDLREEFTRKNDQYQRLSKDHCQTEKKLKEEEKRHRCLAGQNNCLRMKLTQSHTQMVDKVAKQKKIEALLNAKIDESEKKNREIEKKLLSLSALAKKQEELISVLQQQKESIATAKMTKSLEEQLMSLIYSLSNEEGASNNTS